MYMDFKLSNLLKELTLFVLILPSKDISRMFNLACLDFNFIAHQTNMSWVSLRVIMYSKLSSPLEDPT